MMVSMMLDKKNVKKPLFKITQIDEAERSKYTSYIRKTAPDYLLQIEILRLRVLPFDDEIAYSDAGKAFRQQSLECSFFLNYGDIFLSAINAFECEGNVLDSILTHEKNAYIAKKALDDVINDRKQFSDEALKSALKEYKRFMEALSFSSLIGTVMFDENKAHFEHLKIALQSLLLAANAQEYGATDAATFKSNLENGGWFRTISVDISYTDLGEEYSFSGLYDLLGFEIRQLAKTNQDIKICQHCNRFFIPSSRKDEKYCDFAFKGFKSCKQVAFAFRENSDEVLKTYRRIYKTQNARKRRNKHRPNIAANFEKWASIARETFERCQAGQITIEDMEHIISEDSWMKGIF